MKLKEEEKVLKRTNIRIPFLRFESKFSRRSAIVTYVRNAKRNPSPSDLSDLIVVPSPTSSRYKLSFSSPSPLSSLSLFLTPITLFFGSSYALSRRRVSVGNFILVSHSWFQGRFRASQPVRGTTTPRR